MSDSRIRIWFALFVLAVFCVGMTAGVLIGRRMEPDRPIGRSGGPDGRRGGPGGPGGPPPEVLLQRLSEELGLTEDQRVKVGTALTASRTRVDTLQRDVRGRFDAEQAQLRTEIQAVLTPEQQKKFAQWNESGRGRGRRGPRPGPETPR